MEQDKSLIFRIHAVRRMFEREITDKQVKSVIEHGEVIEDYPNDLPHPSKLILGWNGRRPIHVVLAERAGTAEIIVVTAYEPGGDKWMSDFKRRKK